jgi:hypothetical protein
MISRNRIVSIEIRYFRTLFGYVSSLEKIVPFSSKRVAMCLRRKRAEVTSFSTWGGREF